MRGSLTVVCRTAEAGPRPAALLATFREVADEIVVAADSRSDPATRADVAAVADRVLVYPYLEPQNRTLPWLFAQCRSDWAFVIDDDEVPSLALLDALPGLLADDSVFHCSFPVRWLFPDTATYLDDWPWRPHWAARLLRTDGRLIRFGDQTHRPILAGGPGRYLQLPLWHLDTALRPFEERIAKARRYERARPGMRIAGRSFNYAFYVPELRGKPPVAPVPADERAHVDAVLRAGPQGGPPRAKVETVSRDEIDRFWPVTDPDRQAGRLELIDRPPELFAAEARTLDVRIHNTGEGVWPWGADGVPEVRIGSRWYDATGRELPELQIHTELGASLPPGSEEVLPVHVRAPATAGRYRVEVELIQQHVRWFGGTDGCDVVVRRARRIAIVGDDDTVADIAVLLETFPELEFVRLRRTPSRTPSGYPEAPDGRAYLFDDARPGRLAFGATLLWRSLRLRAGPTPAAARELVGTLRDCDLLVVAGLDGPQQRRERWALGVTERTARSLGVRVAVTANPDELLQLLRENPGA